MDEPELKHEQTQKVGQYFCPNAKRYFEPVVTPEGKLKCNLCGHEFIRPAEEIKENETGGLGISENELKDSFEAISLKTQEEEKISNGLDRLLKDVLPTHYGLFIEIIPGYRGVGIKFLNTEEVDIINELVNRDDAVVDNFSDSVSNDRDVSKVEIRK